MKVQVRKCYFTGKLFEEKDISKYKKHLEKIRAGNREKHRLQKIKLGFRTWFEAEKLTLTSPDMIPSWIIKNQEKIMDAYNSGVDTNSRWIRDLGIKFYSTDEFIKIGLDCKYTKRVSNTHVCPTNNGILNFSRVSDQPTGYPGWHGRIIVSLKRHPLHMNEYPISEFLNLIDIKTGTGGGNNTDCRFECSIFLDDWPGFQHTVTEMEKDLICNILKGTKPVEV